VSATLICNTTSGTLWKKSSCSPPLRTKLLYQSASKPPKQQAHIRAGFVVDDLNLVKGGVHAFGNGLSDGGVALKNGFISTLLILACACPR